MKYYYLTIINVQNSAHPFWTFKHRFKFLFGIAGFSTSFTLAVWLKLVLLDAHTETQIYLGKVLQLFTSAGCIIYASNRFYISHW